MQKEADKTKAISPNIYSTHAPADKRQDHACTDRRARNGNPPIPVLARYLSNPNFVSLAMYK